MTARDLPVGERIAGFVSVIVPVHDRPRLLVEAVESALAQSHPHVEVIVVDDASTDDTPAAIASLVDRAGGRLRALRNATNLGPGGSRERGRLAARGEYLQYLDSDDRLLPGKLERQVAALAAAPEAGIAYGWTRERCADGGAGERPYKRSGERFASVFPTFLAGRVWNTVTPLYRASLADAVGPWSDLRLEEDWEYDCRAGALGARLAYVDDWVCEYRIHHGPRLGPGAALDPRRLAQQARAHRLIHGHAERTGITPQVPEMARFARSLFLLARRCGAAGLAGEARELLELARRASTAERARGLDFRLVASLAAVAGWRLTGRLTIAVDALRRGRSRTGAAAPE
jgi:hypothetical protein